MTPHAFVAMPFGTKPGADGQAIDFDRIFSELLKPALVAAGFDVFRADQEKHAGDILSDMYRELLVADLVVADLTLDNPNVWYELGVRHALRSRGVMLVQGPRPTQPFDLYTDRKLSYHLKNGAPDPAFLKADRELLTRAAEAVRNDQGSVRSASPVYEELRDLREPDWRELMLAGHNEFSETQKRWANRIEIARQKGRPGDILLLAEETPNRALWIEAKRTAGDALLDLKRYEFALKQYDEVLAVDAAHKSCAESRAICLGRLGRFEEARVAVRELKDRFPKDADCWALAGRVEKDQWVMRWRGAPLDHAAPSGAATSVLRAAAASEDASLRDAIDAYRTAFQLDPAHHASGVRAYALSLVRQHLGGTANPAELERLRGGAIWACYTAQGRDPADYWALAGLAEMLMLTAANDAALAQFECAIAAANQNWFALDSTRQALQLFHDLEFHPEETAAALKLVDSEIARSSQPLEARQVLLFAGPRVDAPGRARPRFPQALVPQVADEIARVLDGLAAGPEDIALIQGAAGGDLLFAEACVKRGVRVQLHLPLPEPEFVKQAVLASASGETWRMRYYDLRGRLQDPPRVMPDELGPLPPGVYAQKRCNLWLLYSALAREVDRLRFIALWDPADDGPGGTAQMVREVTQHTERVALIDLRRLAATTN
jgi:tetratricopeptide (TPR) repeat protein